MEEKNSSSLSGALSDSPHTASIISNTGVSSAEIQFEESMADPNPIDRNGDVSKEQDDFDVSERST
jgi:hypothetical protein